MYCKMTIAALISNIISKEDCQGIKGEASSYIFKDKSNIKFQIVSS